MKPLLLIGYVLCQIAAAVIFYYLVREVEEGQEKEKA